MRRHILTSLSSRNVSRVISSMCTGGSTDTVRDQHLDGQKAVRLLLLPDAVKEDGQVVVKVQRAEVHLQPGALSHAAEASRSSRGCIREASATACIVPCTGPQSSAGDHLPLRLVATGVVVHS